MKISINKASGLMAVDGETRTIDTSDMTPGIEVVTFDTDKSFGLVQYNETETEQVLDRDLEGEEAENNRRRDNNLPLLDKAMYKSVSIHRRPAPITDQALIQIYIDRWNAAPPPPAPVDPTVAATAESQVVADVNSDARATPIGGVQPATIDNLQAMDRPTFRAWFNTNYPDYASARPLLRLITWIVIRRLLRR